MLPDFSRRYVKEFQAFVGMLVEAVVQSKSTVCQKGSDTNIGSADRLSETEMELKIQSCLVIKFDCLRRQVTEFELHNELGAPVLSFPVHERLNNKEKKC